MQPQSQDVKTQLNGATNKVESAATSAAHSAMSALAPMATQLADNFGDVQSRAVEAYDYSMDYFKRHPGRCLATGAIVGVVAGFLLRPRRK